MKIGICEYGMNDCEDKEQELIYWHQMDIHVCQKCFNELDAYDISASGIEIDLSDIQ